MEREGDFKVAPPLFSPPAFKHGAHSKSYNQTGLHTEDVVGEREEGWKNSNLSRWPGSPALCCQHQSVCIRVFMLLFDTVY